MPLLEWLERCTLPEEEPVADVAYAREVAAEFVNGLVEAGRRPRWCSAPTSAAAVDALFAEAEQAGLRTTSGLVVRDRLLPESLWTTPQRAHAEGRELAGAARDRTKPLRRDAEVLAVVHRRPARVVREPAVGRRGRSDDERPQREPPRIDGVGELFDGCHYVQSHDRHGLVFCRSVLAHDVHPTDEELGVLAARGASVAHCPDEQLGAGQRALPARTPRAARRARRAGGGRRCRLGVLHVLDVALPNAAGRGGRPRQGVHARHARRPRDVGGRRARRPLGGRSRSGGRVVRPVPVGTTVRP